MAAGVLAQLALLVSGPILARSLGPAQRGVLALCVSAVVVAAVVGGLGLPLSFAYEVAASHRSSRTVTRQAFVVMLAACSLTFVLCVLLLVALSTTSAGARVNTLQILLSAGSAAALALQQMIIGILQGARRFRALSASRLGPAFSLSFLLAVYYLLQKNGSLSVVLALYFLSAWLSVMIFAVVAFRTEPDGRHPAPARPLVARGLRGLVGSASPLDTLTLDQTLVGALMSAKDLGYYAVGNAFSNLSTLLCNGLALVALPQGAALRGRRDRAAWVRRTRLVAALVIVCAVGATELCIGPLIRIFFGQAFAAGIGVARLLTLAGGALAFRRLQGAILQSFGATGRASAAEAMSLAVMMLALLVLVPALGLVGAGLAVIGAAVASNAVQWHLITTELRRDE